MGKHVAKKKVIKINTERFRARPAGQEPSSTGAVLSAWAAKLSAFVAARSDGITAPFHRHMVYDMKLPESTDLYITAACFIISLILSFFRNSSLVITAVALVITIVSGFDLWKPLLKKFAGLDFYSQEVMLFLAVLGCFCVGRPMSGAVVLSACRLVKYIGAIVSDGCNVTLDVTMPDMVLTGSTDAPYEKPLEEVVPEDVIYIDKGRIVPVDGIVVRGTSNVEHDNLSYIALSEPVGPGSYVYAGDMNVSGVLAVKALRTADDTALELLRARDNTRETRRSDAEKRVDRLTSFLSPLVMLAGLLMVIASAFTEKAGAVLINSGIAMFIMSCNSFDFSRMLYSYVYAAFRRMGITAASKAELEKLPDCDVFAFGKSGIITDGTYTLNDVRGWDFTKEDVLRYAAAAEKYSVHPIARFLKNTVRIDGELTVKAIEEVPGRGVSSFVNGKLVSVGNAGYMADHSIEFPNSERSGIVIHVSVDSRYAGCFVLTEKAVDSAYECIENLKAGGAGSIAVLSGSSVSSTKQVIKDLSVDIRKSELTPEEKAASLVYMGQVKRADSYVAYVCKSPDSYEVGKNADICYMFGTEDIYSGLGRADLFCFGRDIAVVGESFRRTQKINRILNLGTVVPVAVDIGALVLVAAGFIGLNLFAVLHFGAAAVSYLSVRSTDR